MRKSHAACRLLAGGAWSAALAAIALLACQRDAGSPSPRLVAASSVQDDAGPAPTRPIAATNAPQWTRWLQGEAYADGLPTLRSPCVEGADAGDAGHRQHVECSGGKVSGVSFSHLDSGPNLQPYEYVARYANLAVLADDAPSIAEPQARIAATARVHVLANAELIVTLLWPTRRIRGATRHVALDLASIATLEALARALGLAPLATPRQSDAWIQALSAKRGGSLGLSARVSKVPGKSHAVRLVLLNRGTTAVTLSEAPYRSPSTALAVWVNGEHVAPGPPPTPEASPPSFVLAPSASKTFEYDLDTYASLRSGTLVVVAPKAENPYGDAADIGEEIPLSLTFP